MHRYAGRGRLLPHGDTPGSRQSSVHSALHPVAQHGDLVQPEVPAIPGSRSVNSLIQTAGSVYPPSRGVLIGKTACCVLGTKNASKGGGTDRDMSLG